MPVPTPLPMQDSPVLSPCAVCRRRFRVKGKPVFDTCFCLRYGRRATMLSLVLTGMTLVGLAVIVVRKKD